MSSELLISDVTDGVMTLTLNRPNKRNAITSKMMRQIQNCLEQSRYNKSVNTIMVTGTGNVFSSGADLNSADNPLPTKMAQFHEFIRSLIDYPKILVAVVNGPAIGMACSMLPLFDFVFSSDNAYFQTPFTQLGFVAEGCSSYTFPRIFGAAKASRLLYLNEKMSAHEAELSGFVTKVFPREVLHEEACRHVSDLVSLPMKSVLKTKELIRHWDKEMLHQANKVEVESLLNILNEGSFLNKIDDSKTFPIIKNKL